MTYLILSILCSTAIAVLMRVLDPYIKNNMVMFTANYLICEALSVCFLYFDGQTLSGGAESSGGSGLGFAIGLGIISGIMYLVAFVLLQLNIRKNGIILASTFMKLGVLVPVLMAILCFREPWTGFQLAGIALAIAAILVINGITAKKSDSAAKSQSIAWLLILLLAGGLTDSTANIYDKSGAPEYKNHYLLFIFAAAILASIVMTIVKKQHFTAKDLLCGVFIGIPNYFSARFLLYALGSVPAIVAYPSYNIAVILLITLIGTTVFREKMDRRKVCGIVLILAAIAFLNV